MSTLLEADNITKTYRGHRALDQVSVHIPDQSIFGLLGPNGAGKTTLIRIINQIIGADQGTILFDNEPLRPEHVSRIGYLPEERGLYKKMEVGEQSIYLARLKGLKRQEARKLLNGWFEKFDLMPWWGKKVEELSKGMQQKVQFIITVLHKPRLLIFDEPFSGFDPINVNLLKDEILRLREGGSTIIFSTHNMGSVEELCDHIALINKSKLVLEGDVREVRKSHSTRLYEAELERVHTPVEQVLDGRFQLVNTEQHLQSLTVRIRITREATPNELLQSLFTCGQLTSFRELTPTMNDIFIKQVTGEYPTGNRKKTEPFIQAGQQ